MNIESKDGERPIHFAAESGYEQVVEVTLTLVQLLTVLSLVFYHRSFVPCEHHYYLNSENDQFIPEISTLWAKVVMISN